MKLWAEKRTFFPDPMGAPSDGLVAIGDEMPIDRLLESYSYGIFPWPYHEAPVLWFCPEDRGVLDFKDFHISRSLRRAMRNMDYTITFNKEFEQVIKSCANISRSGQQGSWITEHIARHYVEFHRAGYAHSVECWIGEDLVGGIYGVYVAGVFAGESMFYRVSNASKICLVHLVEALKENGLNWMDIQMVTDTLRGMGGKYISREQFLKRLEASKPKASPLRFPSTY